MRGMTSDLQRELRLATLVLLILALYGAAVSAYAAAHGQLGLILNAKMSGMAMLIWVVAFSFVFAAYLVDLMVRRRPARPLTLMIEEIRASVLRSDLLVARTTIIVGMAAMVAFYTPFKIMIGHVQGFPYDGALTQVDRLIFGGDAWEVTHALFGGLPATVVLHTAYALWFPIAWFSIVYIMLRPELARERARYLVAFLLCWILCGSLVAYLTASAGPCYVERLFGDTHFRPLMDRLHAIDADLKAVGSGFSLRALDVQDMLWNNYVRKGELFGGGISAMPSMHVSVAVVLACGGWQISRGMGIALTVFAVMIGIGSVHLGWHYAADGIVSVVLTLGIWRASGWLVDRYVMREAPAAAWRPALAE